LITPIILVLSVIAMLAVTTVPASAGTTMKRGEITCGDQSDVVGIWVQVDGGRSGWASWSSSGVGYRANWSFAVEDGARYKLHIGCGGTPWRWGSNTSSGWTTWKTNATVVTIYWRWRYVSW